MCSPQGKGKKLKVAGGSSEAAASSPTAGDNGVTDTPTSCAPPDCTSSRLQAAQGGYASGAPLTQSGNLSSPGSAASAETSPTEEGQSMGSNNSGDRGPGPDTVQQGTGSGMEHGDGTPRRQRSGGHLPEPEAGGERDRGKPKQQVSAAGAGGSKEEPVGAVFVWDLDETLIVFQSLLSGDFAAAVGKDPNAGRALGSRWEELILDFCDDQFFFKEMEDVDQVSINEVAAADDLADLGGYDFGGDNIAQPTDEPSQRKLAYRYRAIQELYSKGAEGILGPKADLWAALYDETDAYVDGWLSAGRKVLKECEGPSARLRDGVADAGSEAPTLDCGGVGAVAQSNANVLVSSGQLVPTLAKCLLFKLDKLINPRNAYSSRDVRKIECFQSIQERWPGVPCCAIGDGLDEEAGAAILNWPFVKVALATKDGCFRIQDLTLAKIEKVMREMS
eukprot:SM000382S14598  [mRNA]  locus=s382:25012:27688:- [translate_table: standard]